LLKREEKAWQVPGELEYLLSLSEGSMAQMPPEDMDWHRFFRFAEKNRLTTQAAAAIQRLPEIPGCTQPILKRKQQLAFKTLRQIQTLAMLMKRFEQEGLRVLTMKGPLLAVELYGDPSLRYSNDLDLLVCEAQFSRTREILLEEGFQEEEGLFHKTEKRRKNLVRHGEEMHKAFRRQDLCVELHWRISFRYTVSVEALWERRQRKTLLGQNIPYIGPEDNLLYLICHAAGHGFSRLRWLLDLYHLFRMDQDALPRLYRRMAQLEVGQLLLITLLLMYVLPGFRMEPIENALFSIRKEGDTVSVEYDPAVKRDMRKACKLLKLLKPLLLKDTDPEGLADRNVKYAIPVVGEKTTVLSYLHDLVKPQEAELKRFDLPDSLFFLYYIIRPFYKLWRLTPFYKRRNP